MKLGFQRQYRRASEGILRGRILIKALVGLFCCQMLFPVLPRLWAAGTEAMTLPLPMQESLPVTGPITLSFAGGAFAQDSAPTTRTFNPCFEINARSKPGKVQLTWPAVAGTSSYQIYRATDVEPVVFLRIGEVPSTQPLFLDNLATSGKTWLYAVGALTPENLCISGVAAAHPTAARGLTNYPPVIYSSPVTKGRPGTPYSYDVNAADPNGDELIYKLLAGPDSMTINQNNGVIAWDARSGTFEIVVEVRDHGGSSDVQSFQLNAVLINTPPEANAGLDQSVLTGQTVVLDGSRSIDADGDSLLFKWALLSRPNASAAVLSDLNAVQPALTIDVAGIYVAQLIVNDGTADSAPDTITLTASPAEIAVPVVVGLTRSGAEASIIAAGLTVGIVSETTSATVPAGNIISQAPAAGTAVLMGTAVNILISLGPPAVQVPDVSGLTQAAAVTVINTAGLTVGEISIVNHPSVPEGNVISQSPAAGTPVPRGSAVALNVSLGAVPEPALVPNVAGLSLAEATTAITVAGLTVGDVTQAHSTTVPSGKVISQTPNAGAPAAAGSPVNLVISLGPVAGPAALSISLTQTVIGGGGAVSFAAEVLDENGAIVAPAPAIVFEIVPDAGTVLGSIPSVSGNQILTSADTRGVFTLRGTVEGTSTVGTTSFTVIQSSDTSPNLGKFSALSQAETSVEINVGRLTSELQAGNTAAIPAINNALKATRESINLDNYRRSTAVAADTGFLPSTAQLDAAGFTETVEDQLYGILLLKLKSKLEEITDFFNGLDPASPVDDEARLQELNDQLADLQGQLVTLNVTVHGIIKYAPQINGLLAVTVPAHLHAVINRVDQTLVEQGLAINSLGDPGHFYQGLGNGELQLYSSAGPDPAAMYQSTQPVFFGILGLFSGMNTQMALVNWLYGDIMEEVTRSIILLAGHDLLQHYVNNTGMEGIITGASLSFHIYDRAGSVIEVSGINPTDPTRSDVYLVGSNAVAAVQGVIDRFLEAGEVESMDDLFCFFENIVDALESAGEAFNEANQIADSVATGCILDGGGNPSCAQLIYSSGFSSVSTGRFPQPVIVLVHDMDAKTGGWAFGIFNFLP
ncbi:MAG: PASTA domain-containing protein [Chitinophagaceae bacterium]|nr:MAG: PASTA domain-containing protein [Chitinophagaceae bacterium]